MKYFIFSILILLFLTACQTHFPITGNIDELEKTCPENLDSIELADIDYLLYANKMVDSMVQSNNVKQETINNRMRISLSPITYDRSDIDMNTLNAAIKNRMLRSGLFIIVSDVDASDFHLSGGFKEVRLQLNSCDQTYGVFSLQLKNNRSGSILWSESKHFN